MGFNYEQIITLMAELIREAIPFGFIFGITEWILYTFFSFVFGKKWLRGDY